ncbi:MAG: hypothetical protein COV91_06045 [Candidatus Taylorbacteria bacterium CG11_big_fil_rev_8_21_14_0_20_46_11]|uniref:PABS domain-containing protein n=1 Tax=Candidatus Taylorbacteria bacterium CG11_big_fil_rev_8_21_14_0_20_46_11 TaxID=1975025 RepID=A0A2H0KA10_9BACT|nr:MAG: hypothetical protein COV91_06045 [Candidatus Taylorbacteria bacterium CG11_big_fil_rev_8_21_14_0_20_46_11]
MKYFAFMNPQFEKGLSLVLASFLGLFLELALIRWLPANVLSIAYFSNIVLISAFLGLGLGCALASKDRDTFRWFPLALLSTTILFLMFRWFETVIPVQGSEWIWSYYGGNKLSVFSERLDIFSALAAVYLLTAGLFFFIGQKVGSLFSDFPPLRAYSLDIAGSLLGVLMFGLFSFFGGAFTTPTAWFAVAGVVTLWLLRRNIRFVVFGVCCFGAILLLVHYAGQKELWSPYYSIQIKSEDDGTLKLFVNRFFHQQTIDFDENKEGREKYGLPYLLVEPERVLVLGSGTGNDVAMAIRHGARKIDAVEIDPVILSLGKRHPARPYDDPRVTVIADDARSFLRRTSERYDMIVLGTLDSHALLSAFSTVRLDNFVYTTESLTEIQRHLSDKGVVALLFSVPEEWLREKLIRSVTSVFGTSETMVYKGDTSLFNLLIVAGPGMHAETSKKALSAGIFQPPDIKNGGADALPTDDWPYLYLASHTIPSHYVKALILLFLLSAGGIFALSARQKLGSTSLNFFFLGAAFLLLETKSVTTLSLLFGSTWLVNVFVFAGIFVVILCANVWVSTRPIRRIGSIYALLFGSLLINFLFPVGAFLGQSFLLKSVLATALVSLPLLFASVIFSYHFQSVRTVSAMFGINLIGAVFGGFLEYSSMLTGLNSLYIVAAVFYLASFILSTRRENVSVDLKT